MYNSNADRWSDWLGGARRHDIHAWRSASRLCPFVAAAIPVPIALGIDAVRGKAGVWLVSRGNPITHLFMRFITVVGLLIPLAIIVASAAGDLDILILGLAIFAGLVWIPHGWGADDPTGFVDFALRAVRCYAAHLFAPEMLRSAAIAGGAALTHVYTIVAMSKTSPVR